MAKTIDPAVLAQLTNVPLTEAEAAKMSRQFAATLETISTLNELDAQNIEATPQVTELQNVYREDVIDPSRTFTRDQALQNAAKTYQGYFVVKAVINES